MDLALLKTALEIAAADEAFAAALDGASSVSASEAEDGSITLDAGSESVVIAAEDLLGEVESESPSMPPPPPGV